LTCNGYGRCEPPADPGEAPAIVPALAISPASVAIAAPSAGAPWPETELVVTIDTGDADARDSAATGLLVSVQPNRVLRLTCSDGTTTCATPVESMVTELQVKCSAAAGYTNHCVLAPPWSFTSDATGFHAIRSVWARPRVDATDPAWSVAFDGGGGTANNATVTFTRTSPPQPFEGRYIGTVTLDRPAGDTSPRIMMPVEAHAFGTALVIVDPTHVLTSTGRLPIGLTGAHRNFDWLGSSGTFLARESTLSRIHDPATGTITGQLQLELPIAGAVGRAQVSWEASQRWTFALSRRGPLDGAECSSTATTCPGGRTCELAIGRCLPGASSVDVTDAAPANQFAYTELAAWSNAVVPTLDDGPHPLVKPADPGAPPNPVTLDAAERLACW